ncbi:hypothetical protein ARAM_006603 [Aspergillus rambellii]|uniref:DNA replication regulator SLD2 n=1 Tax=Aspergillus rambellii TaxID=308745 RepID=A0A0F8VIY8_9EURO|nr:hypothetical protein ARAM_006603 [Aspergillus rambellii]
MATVTVLEIATQATNLRAELKEWERAFAAANGGKKAGRNDIKREPEIAAKYKEYSRLKSLEASSRRKEKQSRQKPGESEELPKKRKHSSPNGPDNTLPTATTPRKSAKGAFETPSKPRSASHPADVDPYDSPSVLRRLFSPSTHMQSSSPLKAAIGPTPQRDGKALGLFDLLSESGGSTATPSATRIASLKGMPAAQTPSKRRTMDTIIEEEEGEGEGGGGEEEEEEENGEAETTLRAERTPLSSGKKYMLSALFATPTTLRYSAMVEDETRQVVANVEASASPQGTNKDSAGFETPSFLRRSTSGTYGASNYAATGTGGLSPIAVRKPPQFVGKGLSALVQGLRDMEEERLEDDLDVLREIEAEQASLNAEVPDSQTLTGDMGRTFKKKGQKRTTRMVRMKPVISKSRSEPSCVLPGENSGDADSDHELVAIAETQVPGAPPNDENIPVDFEDNDSLHTMSDPELDSDLDLDLDYPADSQPLARSKSFSEKMKEAIGVVDPQPKHQQDTAKKSSQAKEKEKEPETKKPSTRKINPQAHANYRSLKIRNRGSQGRYGRRFGRR